MISVIMPCYLTNEEIYHLTEMAIDSIVDAGEIELIIIDNGSTFGRGYLKKMADVYIRNETNMGYPFAVNQGIKKATCDILCITNNDIRVPNNVFIPGLELLQDPKIGSVHYKMIPYTSDFSYGNKDFKTGKERWCTSSFFLIKRKAIPAGGYDENYGMGGYDDWDFWYRVRLNGWQTAYTNKSCYQHYGSWTLSKVPESEKSGKNREYFKSQFGEYPEDIWNRLYPYQMSANYMEGFE